MRRISGLVRAAIGLLVDDGLLAIAALAAVGIAWLLSRDAVLGPRLVVGASLLVLLNGGLALSLARAVSEVRRRR